MRNLDNLLQSLFKHQLRIKMFHFQTKKYGAHKASDDYLSKFSGNLDKIMEVAQGHFGRLTTTNINVSFTTINDNNIVSELDSFIDVMKSLDAPLNNYTDLLNIRDEIIGDAAQFKYLLTFD